VFSWSRRIVCACGLFQKGSPLETLLPPFIVLREGQVTTEIAEQRKGGKGEKKEDMEKKK
jgi:hypothetical protein